MRLIKFIGLILFSLFMFWGMRGYNQTASLMTFNIKFDNPGDGENAWDQRKQSLVELIARYQPDIMGIQEGLYHQVEYIGQNVLGYKYVGVGRDDGRDKGEYCAIYYDSTKFDCIRHETFWLSESPDQVSVGWDAAMERICTYGEFIIKATKDTLHVFNAHFDHVGEVARAKSAEVILNKIAAFGIQDARLVVMGDFNAQPGSNPIMKFMELLDHSRDISRNDFQGPEGTYNAFDDSLDLSEPIDHIFTKNLEVENYKHIGDRKENGFFISDHFPVLIEVHF